MIVQQGAKLADVGGVADGALHLEVVSPARELQAVESPLGCLLDNRREGHVGPLAGEQRDRPVHFATSSR
jgi:hypothetical protein